MTNDELEERKARNRAWLEFAKPQEKTVKDEDGYIENTGHPKEYWQGYEDTQAENDLRRHRSGIHPFVEVEMDERGYTVPKLKMVVL